MSENSQEKSSRDFMRQYLGVEAPDSAHQDFISKAPIGVPEISPFVDWDYYYLRRSIKWVPEGEHIGKYPTVEVPYGFVTDLASIPRVLWPIMPPASKYTHAAIVHDYLYWTQSVERDIADQIFNIGMRELKVGRWKAGAVYQAVSKFGSGAWAKNAELKQQGQSRILRVLPNDPTVSWQEYSQLSDVFL